MHTPKSAWKIRDVLRRFMEGEAWIKRLLLERIDELKGLIHQGSQQQSVNLAYGRLVDIPTSTPDPMTTSEL